MLQLEELITSVSFAAFHFCGLLSWAKYKTRSDHLIKVWWLVWLAWKFAKHNLKSWRILLGYSILNGRQQQKSSSIYFWPPTLDSSKQPPTSTIRQVLPTPAPHQSKFSLNQTKSQSFQRNHINQVHTNPSTWRSVIARQRSSHQRSVSHVSNRPLRNCSSQTAQEDFSSQNAANPQPSDVRGLLRGCRLILLLRPHRFSTAHQQRDPPQC